MPTVGKSQKRMAEQIRKISELSCKKQGSFCVIVQFLGIVCHDNGSATSNFVMILALFELFVGFSFTCCKLYPYTCHMSFSLADIKNLSDIIHLFIVC